eukprot:scaffold22717_cov71-Phaeocystis_antarctica.AAC.4
MARAATAGRARTAAPAAALARWRATARQVGGPTPCRRHTGGAASRRTSAACSRPPRAGRPPSIHGGAIARAPRPHAARSTLPCRWHLPGSRGVRSTHGWCAAYPLAQSPPLRCPRRRGSVAPPHWRLRRQTSWYIDRWRFGWRLPLPLPSVAPEARRRGRSCSVRV